jgi:hypothetical protein
MRRILATAALILCVLAVAAPAFAAVRDPFESPISVSAGGVPATTTQDTTTTEVPFTPPSDERTPDTGFDATTWMGIAYVLVAAGAGVMVLGQTAARKGA